MLTQRALRRNSFKTVKELIFGGGDEVITWRKMTLELQDPSYVIVYQLKAGDTLMSKTIIVHFLEDLLNICKQANEDLVY